jgi:glucuronate isomerase
MASGRWILNENRAFPSDPDERRLAQSIHAETAGLPLVSMHGHVDAGVMARDEPFGDPAEMFLIPDHYVLRMFVSQGMDRGDFGVKPRDGGPYESDHREAWRRFCRHWKLLRGTPSRFWLEYELAEVFGVSAPPSEDTADALYDDLSAKLASPEFSPKALFQRFGIEIMATTDDAASPLADHSTLAAQGWADRVVPTFRPDRFFHLASRGWRDALGELGAASDIEPDSYPAFVKALRERREAFARAGARASDHGHFSAAIAPLEEGEAARLFDRGLSGQATPEDERAFGSHMLFEMARMSLEDGLVMQLHPGVLRDYDSGVFADYGPDAGFDIPVATEFTKNLRPLLEAFGKDPRFRFIVFTVDEDTYSRELAPLAGVYPAMRLGAPWWFLDSPDGMLRFRELVTETAGFYNTSGFVDDTRAFASIPARFDLARRIDARYLARLVAEHRLDLDEAIETAIDLAYNLPRTAYARR